VFLKNPDLPDTRSEIALPLRARGQTIGVLDVQSTVPQAFGEEDMTVLQTLADQVALAISNSRLFQQSQESLEAERRAYGELGRQAWIQVLQTRPELGFVSDQQGTVPAGPALEPRMQKALQTGHAIVAGQDGTALAIPIQVRGHTIGVVDVERPNDTGQWMPDQIAMMQTLAEQLGVALEGARLYQDTQRRAAQERLIGEVTSRIRESLDIETVLKTTASEMRQALDLDNLVIRLATPETDGAKPAQERA
jgi:GAF domain-containing protein